MCGICGVWGGKGHWSVKAQNPAVFGAVAGPADRARERMGQERMMSRALKPFGVQVSSWGEGWLLHHATGASLFVDDTASVWTGAEALAKRKIDPLDPALVASVAGLRGGGAGG